MKKEIADIVLDEKQLLKGFKVIGVIPFHLSTITVATHINLCKIREQIHEVAPNEAIYDDFNNSKLQEAAIPLIIEYLAVALINNRKFKFFNERINKSLRRRLYDCGHKQLFQLFSTVLKLNEPAFFLAYWKVMKTVDNTLLREEKL